MIFDGLSPSTRHRYIGKIHALYLKQGFSDIDDPFIAVRTYPQPSIPPTYSRQNSELVHRILKKTPDSVDWIAYRAFLYLLYDPQATAETISRLTFESHRPDCPQIDDIVDNMRTAPNSKYVFPLGQGKIRQPRLISNLIDSIGSALTSVGMKFPGRFSEADIKAIWIATAIKSKLGVSAIRSIVNGNVPPEYAFLEKISPVDISDAEHDAIIRLVANNINDNTDSWHVMKLRRGITMDDIRKGITTYLPNMAKRISYFYPLKSTARREGKKIIREQVPYLPDLLFFKIQRASIPSLFAHIGNLAWCYRTSNTPDAEYSSIPRQQMEAFQRHIGQFTPDINLEVVSGTPKLSVGSRARICGGDMMVGLEGVVERASTNADGRQTYFLRLSVNEYLRWTAEVDANFLEAAE